MQMQNYTFCLWCDTMHMQNNYGWDIGVRYATVWSGETVRCRGCGGAGLCSESPLETLEKNQALAKQCAEILSFVLKFDELKMNNPAIQNDFSYYRRTLSRLKMQDPGSDDSAVLLHANSVRKMGDLCWRDLVTVKSNCNKGPLNTVIPHMLSLVGNQRNTRDEIAVLARQCSLFILFYVSLGRFSVG